MDGSGAYTCMGSDGDVDDGVGVGGDSIGDELIGCIGILFILFARGVYDRVMASRLRILLG